MYSEKPAFDTPEAEIAFLEQRIKDDQARLLQVQQQKPFAEFPKMVKGLLYNSREEQDAAGPEYADPVDAQTEQDEKDAEADKAKSKAKAKKEHA